MSTDVPGRTAPWAKALAAVLLLLLAAAVISYTVGRSREADRKDGAAEATRQDAQHFADEVLARGGTVPSDRRGMVNLVTEATRQGIGRVYRVEPADGRIRVLAEFSRTYQRFMPLFGPAEDTVGRCYTVDIPSAASPGAQAKITEHGADKTCTDVMAGH